MVIFGKGCSSPLILAYTISFKAKEPSQKSLEYLFKKCFKKANTGKKKKKKKPFYRVSFLSC